MRSEEELRNIVRGALTTALLMPLVVLLLVAWWYLLVTVYEWFGMGFGLAAAASVLCLVLQGAWLVTAALHGMQLSRRRTT